MRFFPSNLCRLKSIIPVVGSGMVYGMKFCAPPPSITCVHMNKIKALSLLNITFVKNNSTDTLYFRSSKLVAIHKRGIWKNSTGIYYLRTTITITTQVTMLQPYQGP